jgi:hypothetical protein
MRRIYGGGGWIRARRTHRRPEHRPPPGQHRLARRAHISPPPHHPSDPRRGREDPRRGRPEPRPEDPRPAGARAAAGSMPARRNPGYVTPEVGPAKVEAETAPGGAQPPATWAEATSRLLVVVGRREAGRRRREVRGGGRDNAGCAAATSDGGSGGGRRGSRAEVLAVADGSPPSRPRGRREGHLGFS